MRAPRPDGRVPVTLHLEPDLVERIDQAADERVLGRRRLIELLLEQGLARLPAPELFRTTPPEPTAAVDAPAAVEGAPTPAGGVVGFEGRANRVGLR